MKLLVIAIASVLPASAQAEIKDGCGPRAEMGPYLQAKYNEKVVGRGIDLTGHMIELYIGPNTWTVTSTPPGGPSCMIDGGKDWQAELPGEPL